MNSMRFPVNCFIALILTLFILFCSKKNTIKPEPPFQQEETNFGIIGYLPEYRMSSIPESVGEMVTDLIFFSLEPTIAGGLENSRFTPEIALKLSRIREKGCRIHVAVGGWGRSSGFAGLARNETLRSAFIDQVLNFCLSNQLSGVDYDWEFPQNSAEEQAYSDLIKDTAALFHENELTVSVAVNISQQFDSSTYAALDRVHIMSYDHGGRHSTFDQAKTDVSVFLAQNVPSEKLYLGLPFYGRGISDRNLTMTYAEIVSTHEPGPHIDEIGGIYFNGINTIFEKTEYAMDKQLGGVMIWEVGQDSYENASLLETIRETANSQK